MKPEHSQLNLGCGVKKYPDFWNVDKNPGVNPDQVLDIEQFPWPFDDDSFETITADMILHQVGADADVFSRIIQEMYRVSKHHAKWNIVMPHPRCDWIYEDFRTVRLLQPVSFMAFDQKKNFETIAKKSWQPCHGLDLGIDLEMMDVKPHLIPYWENQLQTKMVGEAELEKITMTSNNVIDSYQIQLQVHKPGRFADWRANSKSK